MIKEIYKEFTFEAAHSLPDANEQNKNIHGHSFKVQVYVKGELDSHKGWITDFSVLEQSLLQIHKPPSPPPLVTFALAKKY